MAGTGRHRAAGPGDLVDPAAPLAGAGVACLEDKLVGARQVQRDDEVMLINSSGTLVRVPVSDIPVLGRNTQGVRIMRLEEGEKLVGLERIAGDDSQGGEAAG